MSKTMIILLMGSVAAVLISGCGQNEPAPAGAPATQPSVFAPPEKAGAQLWSENCSRCHNLRPPESFSDSQWDTVVHHMRFRADLTGGEARKIAEFLKASH